jgi:hypothetical protein
MGVLALLIALLLPPLQLAHKQAQRTRCAAQLKQIGVALETGRNEYGYFPIWDDAGVPDRYTWVDVLLQRHIMVDRRLAYCPMDMRPDPMSSARGAEYGVQYPARDGRYGIDYSYGIGVPLAAGAWGASRGNSDPDLPSRFFERHDRDTAQRLLAADANWSTIYNVSGDALDGHDWAYPTRYDNMIAYRHMPRTANVLYQDQHVSSVTYRLASATSVDTAKTFVWQMGEPTNVNPADVINDYAYPSEPFINIRTGEGGGRYPSDLCPGYYSHNHSWTVAK